MIWKPKLDEWAMHEIIAHWKFILLNIGKQQVNTKVRIVAITNDARVKFKSIVSEKHAFYRLVPNNNTGRWDINNVKVAKAKHYKN